MKDVKNSKLLNILVPCGVILILVCMLFSFMNSTGKTIDVLSAVFLILQFILGVLIVILSIKWTHRATQLYIGLLLVFWGGIHVFLSYFTMISLKEFWPVYGIIAGVLLFVSGFYKYNKMKFGYVIPSVTLVGMGGWYCLFSFKVIKKPFMTVASNLGPIFMLLIAVSLVVLFLVQQKHKEFVFPDDEPGTFSDEDDGIMKIEE